MYPDGQPHVKIENIAVGDDVRVVTPIRSPLEMIHLLQVSEAIDGALAKKKELVIPYLMGARFDRRMQAGDSVDLKVVARLINSCGFERVHLFDVHSDVALQLIERSHSHDNRNLVKLYNQPDAVLVCPDAGAAKKADKYSQWNPEIKETVHCIKDRDLSNGQIKLTVLQPERCAGRNCVIIDDICDGGATFLAIAKQITPKTLTLIVSHGIFSKGTKELEAHFTQIITTDSFRNPHKIGNTITVLPLNL